MGNTTENTTSTTETEAETDIALVCQPLLKGDLTGAWHESQVEYDEGAEDDAFRLTRSVLCFVMGDRAQSTQLLQLVNSRVTPWPAELEKLHAQRLVEVAICKLLMRDNHADLADEALAKAKVLLVKNGQTARAAATTYVGILDLVATRKVNQALLLHQKMVDTWGDSNDLVIQAWKHVLDMAILRSLCEHTRLPDRLFASLGRQNDPRYELETTSVGVLNDILRSNVPKRDKLVAIRIFILGRVGVWK